MSAALTLVVAAGIATAAYRSASSDTPPAALIPANAFAVATADLSLPGGQDGALETLLGRFPGLHLQGGGSIRDRILRSMLHSADASIDYDSDVKPWLGDHVAIAGWTNNGKPEMEVVLQSTDDASARSHLTQISNGDAHVVMHDGYAVLGSSEESVNDAIAAASHESLNDSGPYAEDIAALPGNEALTAWFNGPAAKDLLGGALGGVGGAMAFSGMGMVGSGVGDLFKSRIALGVHVTDTVAAMDMRAVGGTVTKTAPATMLTTLPAGTVGALEVGDPGALVDAATPVIRFFGSFASESSGTTCFGGSSVMPIQPAMPGLSPQSLRRQLKAAFPPGTPHRRALIRAGLRHYRKALIRAHRANGGYAPVPEQCPSTPPPPPTDPLAQIQKFIGISFPDDVKTVLGDRAVVVFGGLELAGLPDIAIRTHPTDLSAAQTLANTMSDHLSTSPVHIDVSTAGDDLVLATSSTYGQEIAKAGDLGAQAQAKTALDGMPDSVTVAAYVDLSRVWPLIGSGVPDGVQHLHAVGFWAAASGDVQTAQLRVVFG